ncbi:MAG TPA: FtsX-like permease family protein [Terriglobales bacterium]|nr:FtsX-like permease family protein [Terriglobales bacterium]
MNKMIFANLVHRPVRSIISIVAVAIEVMLILMIVGLCLGMVEDSRNRTAGIGADLMVQPPGSSFLSGISGAPVPESVAGVIAKLPHVKVVSPVVSQLSTQGGVGVVNGIDIDTFQQLGGPLHYLSGGPFQGPYDAIVDDIYAGANHLRVGNTLNILNKPFRLAGIVEHGRGAREFVPIKTLQDLLGAEGKASIFYVKLDNPSNASLVEEEIHDTPGMNTYIVRSIQQYLSMMTAGNLPGLWQFITVMITVAVTIGFIVIFQAMYTAVMERTREIGILKSLGASQLYIVNAILRETGLLAIAGIVAGIALSFAIRYAIKLRFATLSISIYASWIGWATLIAIVGAMLGALYPAIKAARKDPIQALAYE